jgi:hypothetical protein
VPSPRERYDSEGIRCLQLGGPVTFNYCRRVNGGLPCKLTIGCWHGRLDVPAFLAENFSADELRQAFQPPSGSKLERLIALAERARASLEQREPEEG